MPEKTEPFRGQAQKFVDPFDAQDSGNGAPLADPFDAPEADYSKVSEFQATKATQGQQWRLAFAYLTTPDTEARADIIKKVLPGSVITRDPENRPIVSYQGEMGYIDKPGVTLNGFIDSLGQVAKYLPAGKVAMRAPTLLGRSLLGGAAAGATSVAEDVAAIPQGSEQGVNPERAAITTASSVAAQPIGEKLIAPAIGWLSRKGVDVWNALRGNPQSIANNGTLTEAGAKLAREAGLDPSQLSAKLIAELENAAKQATAAGVKGAQEAGASVNQALSSRFKVPLTKGEVTGDFSQQSLEENLKKMDVTTNAGQIMRGAQKDSLAALRGDTGETGFGLLRQEVGGTKLTDVSDAGQAVIAGTKATAATDKGAYQQAYKAAREAGAALDARNYKSFLNGTREALEAGVDYDAALMPKTAQMLAHLEKQGVWFEEMGSSAARKLPLSKLENTRKLINALWKSADETDRIGLNVLRSQYDEMVNAALDSGRVIGDKSAVESWKAGRALYQRFQQLYAAGTKDGNAEKAAGRAVGNWLKSDNVTGEEAIRAIVNNKALTERLLKIHGADSPEIKALKQGVLEFVFRPALKGDAVSPRLILSQFERFFKGETKEQMGAIFSAAERGAIAEFAHLAKAKIPLPGVENHSNSANAFMRSIQQLGQKLGLISAATGNFAPAAISTGAGMAARAANAAKARSAVRGLTPTYRTPAAAAAVAGGGTDESQK